MGALLGLIFGVGVLLAWRSGSRAPQRASRPSDGWWAGRATLLRRAGLDGVGPSQLLAAQVGMAIILTLAVIVVTASISVALCFGVFGFAVPVLLVRRMSRKRQVALRDVWPEAVDNLASAVRAGMSLPEGLAALGSRGPAELRPPFARFGVAYRASGRFDQCLDTLKGELADPVGDRVCETVRTAREVGGSDLGTVLRTLSELLRSDARTRAELETRQGWIVNAARLAVAAPWLVLLLLGSQSTSLRNYDSAGGAVLLAVGGAVCAFAYRIMLRIGRLPEEQRIRSGAEVRT
jgi:tight adherence protein B